MLVKNSLQAQALHTCFTLSRSLYTNTPQTLNDNGSNSSPFYHSPSSPTLKPNRARVCARLPPLTLTCPPPLNVDISLDTQVQFQVLSIERRVVVVRPYLLVPRRFLRPAEITARLGPRQQFLPDAGSRVAGLAECVSRGHGTLLLLSESLT